MLKKNYLLGLAAAFAFTIANSLAHATPGSLDPEFLLPSFNNNDIRAMVYDSENRLLVVGSFQDVGPRITAILPDGSVDEGFTPGSGPNSTVRSLAIDADGKIYIGGDFTQYDGVPRTRVARLFPDGTLDADFDPGVGPNASVFSVQPLPELGGVLIGGEFWQVKGTNQNAIARLDDEGNLDPSFTSGAGSTVNDIIRLDDGRIVIGGAFTQYNGSGRNRIAVINSDGTFAEDFVIGSGFNTTVTALRQTASGQILVGGSFAFYNGISKRGLARLNNDGTLDETFDAGTGPNGTVNAMVEESGGGIVLVGAFAMVNNFPRSRIAGLKADGSVDPEFDVGAGASSVVNTVVTLDAEERLIIGGVFTSYDNQPTGRLAAIIGRSGAAPADGYFTWISEFYPSAGSDMDIIGQDADPDNDGIPNLVEYALGGNPTEADREQLPVITTVTENDEDFLRISFNRQQAAWDVIYVVQASTNLTNWTDIWTSADHPYSSSQEQMTQTVNAPMSEWSFLRLAVILDEDAVIVDPPPPTDGGVESWLAGFFEDDPEASALTADPDGDGVVNLLEYAFGGNPTEASRANLPTVEFGEIEGETHLGISFIRVRDANDIIYRVEASPDLENWTPIWSSEDFAYNSADKTVLETVYDPDSMDASLNRFLRVNVLLKEDL